MPAIGGYQIGANNPGLSLTSAYAGGGVGAIGGDNNGPFWLFFPQLPPGMQWVPPVTVGFLFPLANPLQAPIVRTDQVPPWVTTAVVSGSNQRAFLSVYPPGYNYNYSAGIPGQSTIFNSAPQALLLIEQALAANGAAVMVAGVANQTIRFFKFEAALDAAVAAGWYKFRDATTATNFGPEFASATGTVPHQFDFSGLSLPPGDSLGILNSAAGAIEVRGGISYTQS